MELRKKFVKSQLVGRIYKLSISLTTSNQYKNGTYRIEDWLNILYQKSKLLTSKIVIFPEILQNK